MEKYLSVHVAQYALIFDERKRFLILQFGESENPEHSRRWVLPGGRVNKKERNLIKALKREIKEETGLTNVKILFPFFNELSKHSGKLTHKTCYLCKCISGTVKINPNNPDNIVNYKWIKYNNINQYLFIGKYGNRMFKRFIRESKKFIRFLKNEKKLKGLPRV